MILSLKYFNGAILLIIEILSKMCYLNLLKLDCRFLKGDIPCIWNKLEGSTCDYCEHYEKITHRFLIIKTGAIGDVIRTTPLIERLKKTYPGCHITWVTLSLEILPDTVDLKLIFNGPSILYLVAFDNYDKIFSLDKDREPCALASMLKNGEKFGYCVNKHGIPYPVNEHANHKYLTGVFDQDSKKNRNHYLEEIFEICGFKYQGERYSIAKPKEHNFNIKRDKQYLVGLNTGCGARWPSRQWGQGKWRELIGLLEDHYDILLLGGEQEYSFNLQICQDSGAQYLGYFDLAKFISLINQCDLIVSQVTMAFHIALALGKKVVLLNNIFNRYEFYLFDQGVIIEPEIECQCFYQPECTSDRFCMDYLYPRKVIEAINSLLAVK